MKFPILCRILFLLSFLGSVAAHAQIVISAAANQVDAGQPITITATGTTAATSTTSYRWVLVDAPSPSGIGGNHASATATIFRTGNQRIRLERYTRQQTGPTTFIDVLVATSNTITINVVVPVVSGPVFSFDFGSTASTASAVQTSNAYIHSGGPLVLTVSGNIVPNYVTGTWTSTATEIIDSGNVVVARIGARISGQIPSERWVGTLPAGSYRIRAAAGMQFWAGTATLQFAGQIAASVTLSNLLHLANGTPKSATATTNPVGLTTSITYNGSTTPPSAPGEYSVTATVTASGYTGSSTGTLTILGLNVTYSSPTYPTSTTPPTNAGSYTVTATTTGSTNYYGATTGTLVINPAAATFSISGTNQEWSGAARSVTAVPTPAGVPMSITYNGSTTAPTDAGAYAVLVGPSSPNYTGAASATLFVRGRLTVASATGGSVTGGGLFLPGETAPISVTLDPLRTFNGWSLSAPNGGATLTGLATNTSNGVRMGSRSVTVTPGISAITYQVTVETSPVAAGGSTLPSGVFTANAGQSYALTAAQGTGNWYFSGWSVVSGPATLTANTPTDADPTPVANVSVTGNAVIRANYSAKAPTSITFSNPGTNGTMPLASTPYPLVATTDSGATVSFSLLSTAPAGIATLAGSTITHRAPPLAGTVNLRMTAPATRTQLAASLDAAYQIADGAVGLVFMQAAPMALAISEETQGSSNFTPVRPNDYSEPQYLTAAKAQVNVAHFKQDGRLMSDAEILAKIQAEPTLKGQMANWLSGQGVQTDYAIALNNQNQPIYTYTSATLNGAPSPTATGQTLSVTGTGMVYDSYWDFSANRWKWRAR